MKTIDALFRSNWTAAEARSANEDALASVVRGFIVRILFWQERARQRCELLGLEDWQLEDIGVTRAQALEEARKPFWRD